MKKLIIIILILFPILSYASTSINVPVENRVYRAIDRLVSLGLVETIIKGQRPYSKGQIARVLKEAENNFDRLERPREKMMAYRLIKFWTKKYKREIERNDGWKIRPFDRIESRYEYLNASFRQFVNNGAGALNAALMPLTEDDSGRDHASASNLAFETYHYLEGEYVAFFAHPRFQTQIGTPNDTGNKVYVQELYAKFGYGNFEFEIGRDQIVWGLSDLGGYLFTNNARGKDLVKISNLDPIKVLGNLRFNFFLSNRGPNYNPDYAYFQGGKISINPVSFFELGLGYGAIIKGDDADSFGSMELLFRIPRALGMEIYGEWYIEDLDNSISILFSNKSAYLLGIYLPRLSLAANGGLRLEYKHTSPVIYRHNPMDGYVLSGKIIGDPLGPDADAVYLTYYYDIGMQSRFVFRGAYERRKGDIVQYNAGSHKYSVAQHRPTEIRYRLKGRLEFPISKVVDASVNAGYERVSNFRFISGSSRNNYILGASLGLVFR